MANHMPSEPAAPLAIKSIELLVGVGYRWLLWQALQERDELPKNLADLQVEIKGNRKSQKAMALFSEKLFASR